MRELALRCICTRGVVSGVTSVTAGERIRVTIGQTGAPTTFGRPCPICGGRGSMSFDVAANLLHEHVSTLRRVLAMRVTPRTAWRVLKKLGRLFARAQQTPRPAPKRRTRAASSEPRQTALVM